MKNLNNLNKSQLIEQINKLETTTNFSLFRKSINLVMKFKNYIISLWLISAIFKIIKNYSLFRKLWLLTNWIIFTIFGISFIDIYANEFCIDILDYLRSTKIYERILDLIENKENKGEKFSTMKPLNNSSTTNEAINERNNENLGEIEPSIYENKYFWIGVIFAISCVLYYYFSKHTYPGENPPTNSNENLKERLKDLFNKDISDVASDDSDKTIKYFKDKSNN